MKTTRRPMWMRLSAIIVAVSMLMCIFAGCQKKEPEKTPMEFLKDAINNTIDKATVQVEEAEIKDFCGSAEVKLNLTEIEMLKEYLAGLEGIDIEAAAKLYFDTAKPAVALEASAGGSGLQIIDALLYLDQHDLALDVGGMLLSETYGIDLANIEKNFDSSVFGPNGAYSIGFSYDELIEMIGETTNAIAAMPEVDEEFVAKAETVMNEMIDTLLKSVEEYCEVTKEDGSVKIGETDVDTADVIIVFDYAALIEVLEDMATYFTENADVREVVEAGFDLITSYGYIYVGIESVDEMYATFEEFLAEIDDIKADAAEEEGAIELAFHVNAEKNEFIGISMETVDIGEDVTMEFYWGPSVDDFKAISFEMDIDGEKTELLITIDKEITDSKFNIDIALEASDDYEEFEATAGINWDKQSGAAAVYVEADGEELRAEANIKVDGDKINIALGKIAVPYEEPIDLAGVYITVNTNDVMPAAPEYTDLLTMTEAEFDALIESITDLIDMFG